jgi:hypothetical protein
MPHAARAHAHLEDEDGGEDDDDALDSVGHGVRDRRHLRKGEEGDLVVNVVEEARDTEQLDELRRDNAVGSGGGVRLRGPVEGFEGVRWRLARDMAAQAAGVPRGGLRRGREVAYDWRECVARAWKLVYPFARAAPHAAAATFGGSRMRETGAIAMKPRMERMANMLAGVRFSPGRGKCWRVGWCGVGPVCGGV